VAIVSLRTKWPYLKTHPGFEDALVRILFRLVSWRTHSVESIQRSPAIRIAGYHVEAA
jgi:hypothetical protein